jgi:phosphatidylglycerol:prolipoprotein diacylglycerol transferase
MQPTVDLGFEEIPLYTALVFLGAGVGVAAAYLFLRAYSRRVYSPPLILDAALVVLAAGWVGARAYHLALNWDYYAARPDEIWNWQAGGLAMRGAFIAGFFALAIFARVRGVSFWRLADAAGLGLAAGQAIGWVGAFAAGANYGAVSDNTLALELPNLYGIVEPRWPLQYAEMGMFALLFLGLVTLAARHPTVGMLFVAYLLIASLANFALGFARGDESIRVGTLRVDQVFDAAFAAAAVVVGVLRRGLGVGNVG